MRVVVQQDSLHRSLFEHASQCRHAARVRLLMGANACWCLRLLRVSAHCIDITTLIDVMLIVSFWACAKHSPNRKTAQHVSGCSIVSCTDMCRNTWARGREGQAKCLYVKTEATVVRQTALICGCKHTDERVEKPQARLRNTAAGTQAECADVKEMRSCDYHTGCLIHRRIYCICTDLVWKHESITPFSLKTSQDENLIFSVIL